LLEAEAHKISKIIVVDLEAVPNLIVDGSEFRQLVLNLCRNGLEAMSDKGKILTISTFVQGEEVVLSVKDEGSGIPAELIDKLGTPFLSMKDNGTGLGLAVCYGIVARHRASIEVNTGPEGTTFSVKFRICQESR
jgi:signal transduction histidine kinase